MAGAVNRCKYCFFSYLFKKEQDELYLILSKNNLNQDLVDMEGILGIEIVIEPASGFFVLLDLTKIIGKSYKGFTVVDDKSLLQFLYTSENIKVLTGNAFCWTKQNQLIIRTTTALSYEDMLEGFKRLKNAIGQLK